MPLPFEELVVVSDRFHLKQLSTDRETGRMRGFGFVEMGTETEEQSAIDVLDGAEWMGRDLKDRSQVIAGLNPLRSEFCNRPSIGGDQTVKVM